MEGTCESTLKGHKNAVSALALGHDGTTLYSGSWDNTIKVWKMTEGTCEAAHAEGTHELDVGATRGLGVGAGAGARRHHAVLGVG